MALNKIQSNVLIMTVALLMLILAVVQIWRNGRDWLNIALVAMSVVLVIIIAADILRNDK